jgi:multisubunit Na+/H+ antiporter MnhC subunit
VLYRWWKLIPEKAVVARHLATFVNGLYAVVFLTTIILSMSCTSLLVCVILSQISSPNLVGLDNTFFVH